MHDKVCVELFNELLNGIGMTALNRLDDFRS